MRRKMIASLFVLLALAASSGTALAHFGMLIPSEDIVLEKDQSKVILTLSFSHPMEGQGMDMAKPQSFGVTDGEKKTELLPTLKATKVMGHNAWQAEYVFKKPGVFQFYFVPDLYWEPAEDVFIQHITKVCIPAFGEEEGWDVPADLPAEIVPLTRPFGNYAGNVFQGQVLVAGEPVPGIPVEVEYYNKDNAYQAPNELMVTQSVLTDTNGIFTFVVPWAGWWGFAALTEGPETVKKDGVDKGVEIGAVLWTKFVDPVRVKK